MKRPNRIIFRYSKAGDHDVFIRNGCDLLEVRRIARLEHVE